jgi:16S rRNA (uracil1498-N3)-methyltransferase
MKLPIFYQAHFDDGLSIHTLDTETSHHIVQVLRMKVGERIRITQGLGTDATVVITDAHKKHCVVSLESITHYPAPTRRIGLAVSPVKNNSRFEWLLEKITEIGVTDIYPLLSHRTEKQQLRMDRLENILISAMLQSQQCWLPALHQPIAFPELVEKHSFQRVFIAHCMEGEKKELRMRDVDTSALLLIGPEGDFTESELALALTHGCEPIGLGKTRLRTETAALVGVVLLVNGISS